MKVDVYQTCESLRDVLNITVSVDRHDLRDNNINIILAKSIELIASRIAYEFCKDNIDEIKKGLNAEEILEKVKNHESMNTLKDMVEAASSGRCLGCNRITRDWESPSGYFAPEEWETLREQGIDPSTGHMKDCEYNLKEGLGN